jgi:hypothetical protein
MPEIPEIPEIPERKAFNFFRSDYEVFKELPTNSAKAEFIEALLEKQFNFLEPKDLKGLSKFAYISQKHSINAQVEGYITKCTKKPTVPPTVPPTLAPIVPPTVQVQEKGKVQVKEKVQVKGITTRVTEFKNSLRPYVETYGAEMITKFFEYWTQINENGRKLHFEKQKTFQLSSRLSSWSKKDYNKSKASTTVNSKSVLEEAHEKGERAKEILRGNYNN